MSEMKKLLLASFCFPTQAFEFNNLYAPFTHAQHNTHTKKKWIINNKKARTMKPTGFIVISSSGFIDIKNQTRLSRKHDKKERQVVQRHWKEEKTGYSPRSCREMYNENRRKRRARRDKKTGLELPQKS